MNSLHFGFCNQHPGKLMQYALLSNDTKHAYDARLACEECIRKNFTSYQKIKNLDDVSSLVNRQIQDLEKNSLQKRINKSIEDFANNVRSVIIPIIAQNTKIKDNTNLLYGLRESKYRDSGKLCDYYRQLDSVESTIIQAKKCFQGETQKFNSISQALSLSLKIIAESIKKLVPESKSKQGDMEIEDQQLLIRIQAFSKQTNLRIEDALKFELRQVRDTLWETQKYCMSYKAENKRLKEELERSRKQREAYHSQMSKKIDQSKTEIQVLKSQLYDQKQKSKSHKRVKQQIQERYRLQWNDRNTIAKELQKSNEQIAKKQTTIKQLLKSQQNLQNQMSHRTEIHRSEKQSLTLKFNEQQRKDFANIESLKGFLKRSDQDKKKYIEEVQKLKKQNHDKDNLLKQFEQLSKRNKQDSKRSQQKIQMLENKSSKDQSQLNLLRNKLQNQIINTKISLQAKAKHIQRIQTEKQIQINRLSNEIFAKDQKIRIKQDCQKKLDQQLRQIKQTLTSLEIQKKQIWRKLQSAEQIIRQKEQFILQKEQTVKTLMIQKNNIVKNHQTKINQMAKDFTIQHEKKDSQLRNKDYLISKIQSEFQNVKSSNFDLQNRLKENQNLIYFQNSKAIQRLEDKYKILHFFNRKIKTTQLIFRSNKTKANSLFHLECDTVRDLLLIVRNQINIFGGFTSASFEEARQHMEKNMVLKSFGFLFSLRDSCYLEILQNKPSITYDKNLGPIFGDSDLRISDSREGFSNLGSVLSSYNSRNVIDYNDKKTFLGGSQYFPIQVYEIYQIHFADN